MWRVTDSNRQPLANHSKCSFLRANSPLRVLDPHNNQKLITPIYPSIYPRPFRGFKNDELMTPNIGCVGS